MEEKKHCKWYNDEFCTNGDSPCVADLDGNKDYCLKSIEELGCMIRVALLPKSLRNSRSGVNE